VVPTPTLDIPTPQDVAALVYPSLEALTRLLPDTSLTHRFLAKVEVGTVPEHAPHLGPCLMWTKATARGYSYFRGGGPDAKGKPRLIPGHVWLHEQLYGPVPDGHELDHICHDPNLCTAPAEECPHRRCVLHTQVKTIAANRLRANHVTGRNAAKVRCEGEFAPIDPITGEKVGHLLTDDKGKDTANCYRPPKNPLERKCRACQAERARRWRAKARMLKAGAGARGLREAGHLERVAG
jgi:hypothetical protein